MLFTSTIYSPIMAAMKDTFEKNARIDRLLGLSTLEDLHKKTLKSPINSTVKESYDRVVKQRGNTENKSKPKGNQEWCFNPPESQAEWDSMIAKMK